MSQDQRGKRNQVRDRVFCSSEYLPFDKKKPSYTSSTCLTFTGGDDPWTEQEEAILNEGVQEFGTNWTLILYKYDVLTSLIGGDAKLPSNSV